MSRVNASLKAHPTDQRLCLLAAEGTCRGSGRFAVVGVNVDAVHVVILKVVAVVIVVDGRLVKQGSLFTPPSSPLRRLDPKEFIPV